MAVIEDRSLYLNSEGGGSDRSANNQDPRRAFVRAYKDYVKIKEQ